MWDRFSEPASPDRAVILAKIVSPDSCFSVSLAAVLRDEGAAAAVACASPAAVLADGGAVTALARASDTVVLADASPPAFSAHVLLTWGHLFLI